MVRAHARMFVAYARTARGPRWFGARVRVASSRARRRFVERVRFARDGARPQVALRACFFVALNHRHCSPEYRTRLASRCMRSTAARGHRVRLCRIAVADLGGSRAGSSSARRDSLTQRRAHEGAKRYMASSRAQRRRSLRTRRLHA